MKKDRFISGAMRYRRITLLCTIVLILLGIFGLGNMNKNEFPDCTIRQGIVVAVAPGCNAEEMEEQVAKPLEDYIFTYKEVKKAKTISTSSDGMVVVQVELNDELNNKDEFWSKFKHGVSEFKSQLPGNVLAVVVKDDFGDTSALLITMESEDKTYRELKSYMDGLKDRLRTIEDVGRLTVSGMQQEQIAIYIDNKRLEHYGINEQSLGMQLFSNGFSTTAGSVQTKDYVSPIYVAKSNATVRDIQDMIVLSTPTGDIVRLRDVADVRREYPKMTSYITNNGKKCLLLSVEMKSGKNIVKMGNDVNREIEAYKSKLPEDVTIYSITDQSQVVAGSVADFLKELCIAIIAVVVVVMLLMPMRVAVTAALTIPISIFISLALFYFLGVELNTVTLAALIVTLGMIVDNSIVIVDAYLELLEEGIDRKTAAIQSASHFKKSILSATLAISVTFFPFLFTMKGMFHDFLLWFPWAILIVLMTSYAVALLLVPYLQSVIIRKPIPANRKFDLLGVVQSTYDRIAEFCFRKPWTVILIGAPGLLLLGVAIFTRLPQRMMPLAERNQFAVEIYLPTGTAIEETAMVADSLEHVMRQDCRVRSITSFHGCSSPRFQNSYAPQMGGTNYAQFIVNTANNDSTVALLDKFTPLLENHFPEARVRFKQLSYDQAQSPVEIRLWGDDLQVLKTEVESIRDSLLSIPQLKQVRTGMGDALACQMVSLRAEEARRLGVSNLTVEASLAMQCSDGLPLTTIYEGDYGVPVVLKSEAGQHMQHDALSDMDVPVMGGWQSARLSQVADVKPVWNMGAITHRNGMRCVSIFADVKRGVNSNAVNMMLQETLGKRQLPEGITMTFGGETESNAETIPPLAAGLAIAACIIFAILIFHYRELTTPSLVFCSLTLCVFGTAVGIAVMRVDVSLTCILGVISLMGILVRNAIIMYDYVLELRASGVPLREACLDSAKRRMRPIFLTSAAASMGVLPMVIGNSGLWNPMGCVIFWGTLITMLLILTVMPVAYWKLREKVENSKSIF